MNDKLFAATQDTLPKEDEPQLLAGGKGPATGEHASGPGSPASPRSTAQFQSVSGMEETHGSDVLVREVRVTSTQPPDEYRDAAASIAAQGTAAS